jgi:hypothetical protein
MSSKKQGHKSIYTKADLAAFIDKMRSELSEDGNAWENNTLPKYLEAMAAWVRDMDGFYSNAGELVPNKPDWNTIADILEAAKVYE